MFKKGATCSLTSISKSLSVLQKISSSIICENRSNSTLNVPKTINLEEVKERLRGLTGGQITLEKNNENGVAYIGLDHVEKRNGLSGKMMVDLHDILKSLEKWKEGKGVILYGKGDTFCSGGFLKTVKQILNHNDGYLMSSLMHDSMLKLRNLPQITLSLVSGKAIGGGAELMLWTDFRLLTQSAEIAFVEAKMGVGTGWAGGFLLRELIGHQRSLDLLLSSRKISSAESVNISLADGLINDGDTKCNLEDATEWLLDKTNQLDPFVIQTVKKIVSCQSLDKEREYFAQSWGGKAQKAALGENLKHK